MSFFIYFQMSTFSGSSMRYLEIYFMISDILYDLYNLSEVNWTKYQGWQISFKPYLKGKLRCQNLGNYHLTDWVHLNCCPFLKRKLSKINIILFTQYICDNIFNHRIFMKMQYEKQYD